MTELSAAVLYLGISLGDPPAGIPGAMVLCIFVTGLVLAAAIDWKWLYIPDEVTLGGMAFGVLSSVCVPDIHGASSRLAGFLASGIGLGSGLLLGQLVRFCGRRLFGRRTVDLGEGGKVSIRGSDVTLVDGQELHADDVLLTGGSFSANARDIFVSGRPHGTESVRVSTQGVSVGKETYGFDADFEMTFSAESITLDREALGFGDVKLLAAIGAVLGGSAVPIVLVGGSAIGLFVFLPSLISGHRRLSSPIQFGPMLCCAAVLWLFYSTMGTR